ncbi:hypothetical protein ACLOJK_015081, partial [Asimina triloba]
MVAPENGAGQAKGGQSVMLPSTSTPWMTLLVARFLIGHGRNDLEALMVEIYMEIGG